jgi:hypothetical protein
MKHIQWDDSVQYSAVVRSTSSSRSAAPQLQVPPVARPRNQFNLQMKQRKLSRAVATKVLGVKQLLTVFPGASDVTADRNTVAYNLAERYPASAVINDLNRNLEGNGCAMTNADPFNPEPGLPFNKWMEYTPEGGGVPDLFWTGAWQCKPSGDVVVFAFRTGRPSPDAPTPAFAVKGAYYSGEQVVAMRQYVAGSGSRSLLFGTEGPSAHRSVSYETCSVCGSVRKKENATRLRRLPMVK